MSRPDLSISSPTGAEGAPIVLLGPSLGTVSAVLWEDVVPLLAERYRVSLWDLPGHGTSRPAGSPFSTEDLADVLAGWIAEHGEAVFVAGVSLGGAVVQQLLLRHPDRVRAGAIVCSSPRFLEPAAWHERAARVRAEGTGVLVAVQSERWFTPDSHAARAGIVERLLQNVADADDESYAKCCEALADFDVREALRGVRTPVLAMYGDADPVSPKADLEAIAAAVEHGRLVGVAGASHLAPAEKPGEVAAELIRFFDEHR